MHLCSHLWASVLWACCSTRALNATDCCAVVGAMPSIRAYVHMLVRGVNTQWHAHGPSNLAASDILTSLFHGCSALCGTTGGARTGMAPCSTTWSARRCDTQ